MTDQPKMEWMIARTHAHLWINGTYCGISVALEEKKCRPTDETMALLNLPPLPKKGG